MVDSDSGPRNITTDHETIREWVETRGGTPAHVTGQVDDDASSLYIVREDEPMEGMESLSWDEFFETFEAEGLAFMYAGYEPGESDEWFYDLVDRREIAERADLDSTEVEQSLLEGEVVESEITETTVVEKTVVETDRIESQIVDSEIIETNLIDHEIQQRELVGATFAGSDVSTTLGSSTTPVSEAQTGGRTADDDDEGILSDDDEGILSDDDDDEGMLSDDDDEGILSDDDDDEGMFGDDDEGILGDDDQGVLGADEPETDESGSPSPTDEPSSVDDTTSQATTETPSHSPVERSTDTPAGLGVDEQLTLDVVDSVRTTMEVLDRKTVESRVVDSDVVESDTVESDAVDIDIEGIEETILESDLIEGELAEQTTETTTRETIPRGAITSERAEGDVIRSQFVERRVVETDSTEHRELSCEIADSHLVEAVDSQSRIVERAIVDRDADEEALLQTPSAGTEEVRAAESSAAASEEAQQAADAETGVMAGGEAGESAETVADDEPHESQPTEDEIGKTVVSGDEEVGIVSDVQGETLYVEADPSLTDKIKAAFEWGEVDDDSYPVEADHIESITDDVVHIREI